MKLQHLSIIFIIIMLPISLIISAYTQAQIDTLVLQNSYDAKLMDASYDAIKAFDINTMNNDLSNVADTVRDDINAAISTFMTSFSASMGVPGGTDRYIKPYVPAMLFTLYDGYYIYAPTLTDNGYTYTLQPYNYYSVRYQRGNTDIVVNYTLDNYIVIYGYVNGTYQVRSGYLVVNNRGVDSEDTIEEYVPVANINTNVVKIPDTPVNVADPKYSKPVTSDEDGEYLYERNELYYIDANSAKNYYEESKNFTNWVIEELVRKNPIRASDAIRKGDIKEFEEDTLIFNINENNNPEDINSPFNQHRMDVIKNSIQDNLNYAITAYANSAGADKETSYNFRLPEINADEWVTISSNICMVTFVQGMPVGTRYYNNYSIVKSTTNKFFVDPENIYYIDYNDKNKETRAYHKIDCPYLNKDSTQITGFSNYNFQRFSISAPNGTGGADQTINYYRHPEGACYYCIVGGHYESENNCRDEYGNLQVDKLPDNKKDAYYKAIGREKYNQYTTTDYFGEKNKQEG